MINTISWYLQMGYLHTTSFFSGWYDGKDDGTIRLVAIAMDWFSSFICSLATEILLRCYAHLIYIYNSEAKNVLLGCLAATKLPFFQSFINSFRYNIFFLHRCLIIIYKEKHTFNKIILIRMKVKTKQHKSYVTKLLKVILIVYLSDGLHKPLLYHVPLCPIISRIMCKFWTNIRTLYSKQIHH